VKRLDADEQQVKTGEIGIEQQVETQTAYILVPWTSSEWVKYLEIQKQVFVRKNSADEKSEYRLAH